MINIIDIIIGVLILFYLLKNAGGVIKTAKNFLVAIAGLIVFGVIAQMLLAASFAAPAHKVLGEAYSVRAAQILIHWVYPPISDAAPKVDNFMKKNILSVPPLEAKKMVPDELVRKLQVPPMTLPK